MLHPATRFLTTHAVTAPVLSMPFHRTSEYLRWFSNQPLVAGRSDGRQALGAADSVSNDKHLIDYI
jgi:hypothetical protein